MKRRNSDTAGQLLAAGWGRLLLGLSLLLVAAGCSTTPGDIGVGLPSVDANTGAYLIDTLTIRASTVLRDSVITSTSSSLLVGRYIDPQLGPIKASSYATLSLGDPFTPDQTQVPDSAVLVLVPTTYRYGDTTKTQTLVEVRELTSFIPTTQYGFASPTLTSMTGRINNATSLTPNLAVLQRRARPSLTTLRLRLTNAFRDVLMAEGKSGSLTTQEQLDKNHPGLAFLPGSADAAALVQLNATSTDAGVILYYHDPTDVSTALSHQFGISGGRHFYQAEQEQRSTTVLAPLTTVKQLDASRTGNQVYIESLLGLQTKLEIPYLFDLRNFGPNLVITSANMTAEIPVATLSNTLALTPPTTLTVSTTDQNNHQGTAFTSSTYSPVVSTRDGITQAGYAWSVLAYCQNVLNNSIPNNGMLLSNASPALPERVILGGPKITPNRMQLRLYLISNN